MTTIREIRRDEVDLVTDLYPEPYRSLSERDAEWGVPDREPIRRWIERTTETDEAVCLVPEIDGETAGYLLASVSRHPRCRASRVSSRSSTSAPAPTRTGSGGSSWRPASDGCERATPG